MGIRVTILPTQKGKNMHLKKTYRADGVYLSIETSYYDENTNVGGKRIIKRLGYLKDLKKQYPDPIAHFEKEIEEINQKEALESASRIRLTLDRREKIGEGTVLKNVGYAVFKQLYRELEIDYFWKFHAPGHTVNSSKAERIFCFLVMGRILFSGTVENACAHRDELFEDFGSFTLDDIYSFMDYYAQGLPALLKWVTDREPSLEQGIKTVRDTEKHGNYCVRELGSVKSDEQKDFKGAYFTICTAAVVLVLLLESRLEYRYRADQIVESIRRYGCFFLAVDTYQFVYFDEILKSCEKILGISLEEKYRHSLDILCMLGWLKR